VHRGGFTAPSPSDSDGIARIWLELDSLDWHDDLCTPDCLTRRAHARQLLVAKLARPRLSETQLSQMAVQTWNELPLSRRESLDYSRWAEVFVQARQDVVRRPGGARYLTRPEAEPKAPTTRVHRHLLVAAGLGHDRTIRCVTARRNTYPPGSDYWLRRGRR
jgi:hypothetical protein